MIHHSTRTYILPLAAATAISLGAFISVIMFVDPFVSGIIPHAFFYLTLFMTAVGIFTLAGIMIRKKYSPGVLAEQIATSFRQAVLLGGLTAGLLLLQANNLLYWWVGITLILFIISAEIFFNA